MSTVRLFLLALMFLPFCYDAPLPAQPAKEDAVGKRVAFLVGVNKYKKPGFPNLEYAERDVEKLGEEIDKRLKFDKVVVLKGDDATRENIEKQLKSLVGPLGENDLILVVLSGHGLQFEVNAKEEGFFCPVDAVVPDKAQPQGENLFGMEEIIGLLKKKVGKKLILVDACRNEPPLPGKGAKGLEGKNDLELPPNTAVFFSCSARQQSWENAKAGGGHSVFTHCVLEALRGGAVKNGSLSWTDLVDNVEERMADDDIRKLLPRAQSPVESKNLGRTLLARSLGGMKVEPKVDTKREPPVDGKGPKPGEERVFDVGNGVKMAFCWIPGTNGKAMLGSPKGETERGDNEVEHEVELDGFWMAKMEMTQRQYVKLTGKENPSRFCAGIIEKASVNVKNTDDFPVERVSWEDAQECIKGMKVHRG